MNIQEYIKHGLDEANKKKNEIIAANGGVGKNLMDAPETEQMQWGQNEGKILAWSVLNEYIKKMQSTADASKLSELIKSYIRDSNPSGLASDLAPYFRGLNAGQYEVYTVVSSLLEKTANSLDSEIPEQPKPAVSSSDELYDLDPDVFAHLRG